LHRLWKSVFRESLIIMAGTLQPACRQLTMRNVPWISRFGFLQGSAHKRERYATNFAAGVSAIGLSRPGKWLGSGG
jgi:hypothetical protein